MAAMPKKKPEPWRGASAAVHVRNSRLHGRGVFAREALTSGAVVGVYAGQRYSPDELEQHVWDDGLTYLFGLSDGSVIDGAIGGNATRFLNHACEPNCEAVEFYDEDDRLCVRIETLRSIAVGEELTLDYALQIEDSDPAEHPCNCGATRCRGTLALPV